MKKRPFAILMLFAFAFSLSGLPSLIPGVEAASSSTSARIIKKLKKQIASLKAQIAAVSAVPAPFLEMVEVGNAGNVADSTTYGAVPYEFQMGKYEVTLAQYTTFLNAVAATDPFALYNASMEADTAVAGIARSGSDGSYTYSVIGSGARPVTYVSWFDAARFCNWLHNGRPSGAQGSNTTERGVYTLDGATSGGITITRNPGARFWIPSENEWYKAAYHQPATDGGDPDGYWYYPTRSNTEPTAAAPPGTVNSANFSRAAIALTAVGAYTGSGSFYGTFDQGGNVFEWSDVVYGGPYRGIRGGSWDLYGTYLSAAGRFNMDPGSETNYLGFRLASP